jgi:hypothetical protein
LKTVVFQNVGNFTSWSDVPEDLTHQQHCCENLKSCIMKIMSTFIQCGVIGFITKNVWISWVM